MAKQEERVSKKNAFKVEGQSFRARSVLRNQTKEAWVKKAVAQGIFDDKGENQKALLEEVWGIAAKKEDIPKVEAPAPKKALAPKKEGDK